MNTHLKASSRILRLNLLAFLLTLSFPLFVAAQSDDETPDPVAAFNNAQDLHEKGNLAGAIDLYKKALKIEPNFPEAEYQCGIAYLALDKRDEAEKSFRKAVELRPEWTLAMTSLGSLLVQNDKFTEADRILSKALELDPQNSPALAAMSDLRLKTKASPAVLNDLLAKVASLTLKANPTASIWIARSTLENALGKRDAARGSITNALVIDPKNRSALLLMADMALEDGDVLKAKEAAKLLQTIASDSDSLKLLNTNILLADGGSEESVREGLERQLENDPKNTAILSRLCYAFRLADPQKALGFCRRASEAHPTNINYAVGFGAALVQAKQFAAAVDTLRRLIEIAPNNATAHANLATALFELKRYAEAKAEFEWLTTKQPNLAVAYFFLAIVHDNLGEYADAMANYQQFLRIADPATNKPEIDKVNLRLPALQQKIKRKK